LLDAYALVLLLLALGKLCQVGNLFTDSAAESLNRFVIVVALPGLVLQVVPGMTFTFDVFKLALLPYACSAVVGGAVWWLCARLGFERATQVTLTALSSIGNTAFLGYPMVQALLGESALPYALVFDQMGSFVLLAVGVPWLILANTAQTEKVSGACQFLNLLKFPPLWALLLGLLIAPLSGIADSISAALAATVVPITCFAVGLKLKFRLPKADLAALGIGLVAKLLAFPALAWMLAHAIGLDPLAISVAALQAGMPAMISAAALLSAAQLKQELGAALVSYGLLLAMVTLPLIAYIA